MGLELWRTLLSVVAGRWRESAGVAVTSREPVSVAGVRRGLLAV